MQHEQWFGDARNITSLTWIFAIYIRRYIVNVFIPDYWCLSCILQIKFLIMCTFDIHCKKNVSRELLLFWGSIGQCFKSFCLAEFHFSGNERLLLKLQIQKEKYKIPSESEKKYQILLSMHKVGIRHTFYSCCQLKPGYLNQNVTIYI